MSILDEIIDNTKSKLVKRKTELPLDKIKIDTRKGAYSERVKS